jgi:glycosyltransferase involved in cell wall biosynthesis
VFRIRLYYLLKPLLPARLRLALRRWRANRILKRCAAHWPVYEAAGRRPDGWPGWPSGKEFAFVLTHDVEGQEGLDRCRQLAEMEMEHGFRSSFNFIPEGAYQVPEELLKWLQENGFETGIHDLRHDGTLFQSRKSFGRDAAVINRHLESRGDGGFRAGFMLHRLDWLHALNIQYDASTFDVDPFEAQQDGVQTVFPFWVPLPDPAADSFGGGNGAGGTKAAPRQSGPGRTADANGYVELPYTLVQDYNLFVVLKARSIDVWKQKLCWLATRGGMALLDSHPDYMAMPGSAPGDSEFPVERYREFLNHVRSEYEGRYWHALPREVAGWCRTVRPEHSRPPRRVVMLTYSFYDSDNRVRRYAETLARRGDHVRIFCLGSEEQVRSRRWETLNGVEVFRLQSRSTSETGKWSHALRLGRFFFRALGQLGSRRLQGCDLLHVHNIPDFLVFAGMRLKLRRTPIILDIHDIVPELYESKFRAGRWSPFSLGLRIIEKLSCRFADHVIVANHIWKTTISERAAPPSRVTALVNNVDLDLFSPRARTRHDGRIVLLYPGSLNHHQGLDLAIDAVKILAPEFPSIELHIYGSGPALPQLKAQAARLGLENHVRFFPGVRIDDVPSLMANADIGIVPKRAEGFGDQAYSTKVMEFMSQGLPVVLSKTRIDSYYFGDSEAAFFESGNPEDLAGAVRKVLTDSEYREQLSKNGLAYALGNSWDTMQQVYLDIVNRLTMTGVPFPPAPGAAGEPADATAAASGSRPPAADAPV